METLMIICGLLLVIVGIVGSVLPGLPGAPLYVVAILLAKFFGGVEVSTTVIVVVSVLVVFTFAADWFVPIMLAKVFGGTKAGMWGSIIGMLVGMFLLSVWGLIVGPFVGAVCGELATGQDKVAALKSGVGNFLGFVLSTGLKIVVGIYCFVLLISYFDFWKGIDFISFP